MSKESSTRIKLETRSGEIIIIKKACINLVSDTAGVLKCEEGTCVIHTSLKNRRTIFIKASIGKMEEALM